MKTTKVCAVVMVAAIVMMAGPGGASAGARSPEHLGAHWARVSDEAKVQLLVDGLRSIGGGTDVVVMRKHASAMFRVSVSDAVAQSLSKMQTPKDRGATGAVATENHTASYTVNVQGPAASVEFSSGERLFMERRDGVWSVTGGSLPKNFFESSNDDAATSSITGGSGVSVGESFIEQAVSREHGIGRLTKNVTRSQIDRQLFGEPGKTASYYSVVYQRGLPAPVATYVQFVLDAEWNRIVYGNMNNWIKTYDVQAPSAIAVDADGNVFVGEPASKRVLVLKLVGATLQLDHTINDVVNPTDIAINDNGTPFNTNDDFLYVADATRNKIFKFTGGVNAHALVATFGSFDAPTGITVGRWNGANNRMLYVVDKIAKRVCAYGDEGGTLSLIAQYRGNYSQYFTSIKTDHFGNVYVVDNVNSKVFKFTPLLELLDQHGGNDAFAGLGSLDIPFARIDIDGDRRWVGFDQMFAIERWDNTSGVQRRKFGIRLRNIDFRADDDVSAVSNTFTLTDVGNVTARVFDENNRLVRTLSSSWFTAGAKNLQWDRRSDGGMQVPAGTYRYELGASSAYGADEPTISNTRFYLPLYYAEDCGSASRKSDPHLVQGSVVAWGSLPSQTASEHASSVQYRFTNLNPAGDYEVAAEYAAHDALQRLQELSANGRRLGEPTRVTNEPVRTGFVRLPREAFANGEVTIAINKLGEGSAIVTQLWIKEKGKGFNPEPMQTAPTKYALDQNYPNPFNPTTTIRYAIPEDGLVTLNVYNIAGQEVATLVNEQKKAGKYEIVFDAKSALGNSLASGVYLYRVKAANFSEVKKMVLLK